MNKKENIEKIKAVEKNLPGCVDKKMVLLSQPVTMIMVSVMSVIGKI
ncbi:MAG: hypothetical protein LIO44_04800 [Eubacterium sp.]|nr:hypothetical protein [Eubacterium sp.]